MNLESKLSLHDGNQIPILALGVWRSGEDTKNAVLTALKAGYRHIDTASAYGNEQAVGEAIKESGIPREEIFITTKVWNEDIRKGSIKEALTESLYNLQLDYIDLYLIHWPTEGYEKAFLDMVALRQEGKIRSIGVSNFKKHHLETLVAKTGVLPTVNQIEFNPGIQDYETVNFCKENKIVVEAWSPLGSGMYLNNKIIGAIASEHGKSIAQIILRWLIQKNLVILPKSTNPNRILENSQLFDFVLDSNQIRIMDTLHQNTRTGPDPDNFNF